MSMPPSSFPAAFDPAFQRRAIHDVHGRAGRAHAFGFQRADRILHLIGIARADGDVGAFARQRFRNRAPDAARAAQYDGVLALELEVHVSISNDFPLTLTLEFAFYLPLCGEVDA